MGNTPTEPQSPHPDPPADGIDIASYQRALGSAREANELLQQQAIELEHQMEELQSLQEELEQTNEALHSSVVELEQSRRRTDEALERIRAILDSLPESVTSFDGDWRFTYLNPAARKTLAGLGRSADAVIGRVLWEEFPELLGTRFETESRRAMREQRVVEYEEYYAPLDQWSEVRAVPFPDGLTSFSRDVTERHRASAELARSERQARFMSNASRMLAESLDYEQTLRVVAGAAVPAIGDWCAVDIIRDPLAGRWPPEVERLAVVHTDPEKVSLAIELQDRYPTDWSSPVGLPRALREGTAELMREIPDSLLVQSAVDAEHLRILRALGLRSAIVVPLQARGMMLGALTLVTSESGRVYDERDLVLAEDLAQRAALAIDNARLFRDAERARLEAEAASRAKTEFLTAMSHELRTPLNAIDGYAELLELDIRGKLTPEQREDVGRIRRSQRHLLGLINDLLHMGRIEAGRVEYLVRDVALEPVLESAAMLVRTQAMAKLLTFSHVASSESLVVAADEERLRQILLNLLSNAVKFTPEGGAITMSSARRGATAEVTIADTGVGIPEAQRERIFEPFFQLHREPSRRAEGTGLGLSISRDLARGMDGDLTVREGDGSGSAFVLSLPLAAG